MTYPDLIIALEKIHLYPSRTRTTTKGEIKGLELDCSPLLKDDRKEWIEKHIEGINVAWQGNGESNEYLLITFKK